MKKYIINILTDKISTLFAWAYLNLRLHKIFRLCKTIKTQTYSKIFILKSASPQGKARLALPFFSNGEKYIKFKQFTAGPGAWIECLDSYIDQKFTPQLIMGENVGFAIRCHIAVINNVQIGDNCRFGSHVLITDHSHGTSDRQGLDTPPNFRPLVSKGPIIIEDNVWVCDQAIILANVRIGKGSIIAAGTVVNKDIPPYSLVVGSPCRIIPLDKN